MIMLPFVLSGLNITKDFELQFCKKQKFILQEGRDIKNIVMENERSLF